MPCSPNFAEPAPESSENENFLALLSTLPDEVQDEYLKYKENTKKLIPFIY